VKDLAFSLWEKARSDEFETLDKVGDEGDNSRKPSPTKAILSNKAIFPVLQIPAGLVQSIRL
jgi:hypothetical protein